MMAKRLLLASFDYLRLKDPQISLASSSILASLKSSPSLETLEIVHRQYNVKKAIVSDITSTFRADVQDFKPDIIGTGVYIWNERFITHAFTSSESVGNGHALRTNPISTFRPTVILGGPQITYNGKGSLEQNYPYGHIFIRGYAEQSFAKVLEELHCYKNHTAKKPIKIAGFHYKGDEDLGLKSAYNFEQLPSPLLMDRDKIDVGHHGFIRLETKRGCPFTCSFCQHKDSYEKRFNCEQSRVDKEIQWIVAQGINDVSIVDPIFNSGKNYVQTLQSFLDYGYAGRLSLQSRFEMAGPDYLEMCSKLLESGINIELEFGIQTINREESKVIQRSNNLRKVLKVSEELRTREIPFQSSLIYGLPLQTLDSFRFGVDWVQEFIKPSLATQAWPLMLLKGTQLYELKDQFKMEERILDEELEEVDPNRLYAGIPHVVSSSSFTEEEWNRMKQVALGLIE